MVVADSEMISRGQVEPPLQSEQQQPPKNHAFSSFGRLWSIYSLTLDEFQNTLCERGKNFGSMNMDEFLNSFWTAEENQAQATSAMVAAAANDNPIHLTIGEANSTSTDQKGIITNQPSLPRQGSLTLPGLLSLKTVEEVWAEIHKTQQEHEPQNDSTNPQNPCCSKQLGEMTLEDFLVTAGVVREQIQPPPLPQQQQPPYGGFYQNNNTNLMGSGFVTRPDMNFAGVSSPSGGVNAASYQPMPQTGEPSTAYSGSMKRGGGYAAQPTAACFGGRMRNGGSGGGNGQVQGLGMGSRV